MILNDNQHATWTEGTNYESRLAEHVKPLRRIDFVQHIAHDDYIERFRSAFLNQLVFGAKPSILGTTISSFNCCFAQNAWLVLFVQCNILDLVSNWLA